MAGPSGEEAFLGICRVEKAFGETSVLGGADLDVKRGEFVSLLGPSGCGKTTLLRIVAGLLRADRGTVTLAGEDLTDRPPHRRNIGVVFQNYALFPHLTVGENVSFGMEARGTRRREARQQVPRYLDLVQLSGFADRRVTRLSGGQMQRVAVARALATSPKLLLLDEPFSALDRKLRDTMQIELKRLLRELGITAVLVTHDQEEALVMSDRVAVMNRGRIEQFDTPRAIYLRPRSAFALGFVGLSTRLSGEVTAIDADVVTIRTSVGTVRAPARYRVGSRVLVGIRPERIRLDASRPNVAVAQLRDIIFLGSKVQLHLHAGEGETLLVETGDLPDAIAPGAPVSVSWDPGDTLVYPRED
jgi:putative spermidine/putrescine transport system ATP-binding protein